MKLSDMAREMDTDVETAVSYGNVKFTSPDQEIADANDIISAWFNDAFGEESRWYSMNG